MKYQRRNRRDLPAHEMRERPTEAERWMWAILRNRKLCAAKFRRQHRILWYVLDFYSPELHLAIEVDGGPHFTELGKKLDDTRTERLGALGISVLRFENKEVLANPTLVANEIKRAIDQIRAKNQRIPNG